MEFKSKSLIDDVVYQARLPIGRPSTRLPEALPVIDGSRTSFDDLFKRVEIE